MVPVSGNWGSPSCRHVSSMVRGLAEGSGLAFTDAGHHEVKGFERPIEVAEIRA
jgi:hypothetical protein